MCFFWICLFMSYDKFLAMRLFSEFFRFSEQKVFLLFFSPRLLLSNWYYSVIWCISGEKSRLVENRLNSFYMNTFLHVLRMLRANFCSLNETNFSSFLVIHFILILYKSLVSSWDFIKRLDVSFFLQYGTLIKITYFLYRNIRVVKWNHLLHWILQSICHELFSNTIDKPEW